MTNRELFHATMRRENGDKLLHLEQGFNIPYKKWYKQGMPLHVQNAKWAFLTEYENLYDHFNVAGMIDCPSTRINQFCIPTLPGKILSDDGKIVVYTDGNGNTFRGISSKVQEERNDGGIISSPPTEIDFFIKCRNDYEKIRGRYTGNIQQRIDIKWFEAHADDCKEITDYIPTIVVHGPFAFLRTLLGTDMAMLAPYDDPDWVRIMLEDHIKTIKEAVNELAHYIQYDLAFVWEDCCGSTGPFMSPSVFDEQFAWWYREWKAFTKSIGIPWTMMDTDGDPSPLVSRWYQNGIDCIHPWEVNSVDMLKFAKQYPEYIMMGGIYKHIFEPANPGQVGRFETTDVHKVIDEELERIVKPMRERGGYFISLDHWAYWGIIVV